MKHTQKKTEPNGQRGQDKTERIEKILTNGRNGWKVMLKNPFAKVLLAGATIYGLIWVSGYFLNASAKTIRAYKNFKGALNG